MRWFACPDLQSGGNSLPTHPRDPDPGYQQWEVGDNRMDSWGQTWGLPMVPEKRGLILYSAPFAFQIQTLHKQLIKIILPV